MDSLGRSLQVHIQFRLHLQPQLQLQFPAAAESLSWRK